MRVAHIVASLSSTWGGPTAVVIALNQKFRYKGIKSQIFGTLYPTGHLPIKPPELQIHLYPPTMVLSNLWTAHSFKLKHALTKHLKEFDLIHIHEIWHHPQYAAYNAAKHLGLPYIITVSGALSQTALSIKPLRKKLFLRTIQRTILENASCLHAFVDEEKHQIRRLGLTTPIQVIPNGVDITLPENTPSLSNLFPDLKGCLNLLFLGRLHPIKGLDILLKSFSELNRKYDNIRLVLAGPDSQGYRKELEKLADNLNIRDKIIFTGMLTGEHKLMALKSADIFVLPSYSEGFSMAILEALASGIPVVISDKCNFPEVAGNNAGKIVEPTISALTSVLISLIEDPKLRKNMGQQGMQLVAENYTWDKIADQMINLYEEIIRKHKAFSHSSGIL